MKKSIVSLAALLVLSGLSMAQDPAAKDAAAAPAKQTVQGEVLDLSCFLAEGASGSDHAECAKGCLKKGAPAGLLTADQTVYLLLSDHNKDHSKAYQAARQWGGEKATITGSVVKKGGLNAILVEKAVKTK